MPAARRDQPVEEHEMRYVPSGNPLPPPLPTGAAAAPTLEQPTVPIMPPTVPNVSMADTAPLPRAQPIIDFPVDDDDHVDSELGWGAVFGIVLAIIGLVVAIAMVARSHGGTPTTSDLTLPPVTTSAPTSAPPVTVAPSVVAPAPTTIAPTAAPPATAAPVTAAPVTAAPTNPVPVIVAPTTNGPATTVPVTTVASPSPPAVAAEPVSGPGTSQVLSDPLPSGVSYADASPTFALEQRLADALATEDWDTVRSLEPAKANSPDSAFAGYKGLDRASLVLVDARPERAGYRHLFVSVANELNGAQTSLYCLEWSASTATGTVVEHGGTIGRLATLRGTVSSQDVVNDPTLVDLITRRCVWR